MNRIPLKAKERTVLGKKVKNLRKDGLIPGHVFGRNLDSEHVTVDVKDFVTVFKQAGETGLIDLKIGDEKVRPVMVRDIQYDPIKGLPLHVDFYQVNLKEKVAVPVPIVLIGEENEKVHIGEAMIMQTLSEVEVEALPTDLIEKFEVDITPLQEIDDAITVGQLNYDHELLTVNADPDEIIVKLAAVVAEPEEEIVAEEEAEGEAAEEAAESGEEAAEEETPKEE